MDEFFAPDTAALICSDDGRTYMNIQEDYGANHETVVHNRRFVNQDRVQTWFDRHGLVDVKVHTNTIEGAWGHLKPKLRVKRGIKKATKNRNGEAVDPK